jgi:hypothetical protein
MVFVSFYFSFLPIMYFTIFPTFLLLPPCRMPWNSSRQCRKDDYSLKGIETFPGMVITSFWDFVEKMITP